MKKNFKYSVCLIAIFFVACSNSQNNSAKAVVDGQEVYDYNSPQVNSGPEFGVTKFKVYTVYKPNIQRRNFNGIFDIQPRSSRIVRAYWSRKFVELTRDNYYNDFFVEFYENMSNLVSYPMPDRQKELTMDSLEKSFHLFCEGKKVGQEFKDFQQKQKQIYGIP